MAKVWCEWERGSFEQDQFEVYQGGPLLQHVGVMVPHLNNGMGIGAGPAPAGPVEVSAHQRGPGGWAESVSYGNGPMAKPARDE